MAKPLRVDPAQLQVTAESLHRHAESFSATHEQAQSRAGSVALGASKAAAALTATLGEWQTSATQFAAHHVKHADGHRAAAQAYTQTDTGAADEIEAAGRDL
ncbi:WXG100 family type VII secretion target [Mycobacterium sp. BMJ-28]